MCHLYDSEWILENLCPIYRLGERCSTLIELSDKAITCAQISGDLDLLTSANLSKLYLMTFLGIPVAEIPLIPSAFTEEEGARAAWIYGRAYITMGRFEEAKFNLFRAYDYYRHHQLAPKTFGVILDLAILHAAEGDHANVDVNVREASRRLQALIRSGQTSPECDQLTLLLDRAKRSSDDKKRSAILPTLIAWTARNYAAASSPSLFAP
jgi:hypothetical protein